MKLPFKPHLLVLLCSAGLFAASGAMFVMSRATDTPAAPVVPVPATQQPAAPTLPSAPVVAPTYSAAQLDQWTAPVALYPDALLSQILMASTYPSNVIQAAQWSKDNPKMQGDAAIQAVAGQPWDPSVKSLVAFPQLTSLMGENPQWIQNLGDAFLAQPKDVMDSVQRLRLLAQQTGALQSTPQQTVTTEKKAEPAPTPTKSTTSSSTPTTTTTSPTVIKIESADPQVVYVPTYNPNTVYGTWPNTAYPPTYLPPSPGEQFTDSLVKGLGFSLGVATTYAIFSNIDWDDDDDWDHHHNDDYHGGYNRNGDNNININVDNFNKISGEHLTDANRNWQHNPAYREGVPYPTTQLNNRFHSTNSATGLSATQNKPVNRDSQRQAALAQVQQSTGKSLSQTQRPATKDAQRQAANQQLKQISQRNNYRGYDNSKPQATQRASNKQQHQNRQTTAQRQERRSSQPAQQRNSQPRANALSGNDSRSANWQAQQQRGAQSRQQTSRTQHQPPRQPSAGRNEHREFRHR